MAGWLAGLATLAGGTGCSSTPAADTAAAGEVFTHPAVMVRGRVAAAGLELDPLMTTAAAPTPDLRPAGAFRLRGLDDDGTVSFDVHFDTVLLAEVPGAGERQFLLVVPLGAGGALSLARVELTGPEGHTVIRRAMVSAAGLRTALAGTGDIQITRDPAGGFEVRWDAERFPLLQLREPESGAVLALGRSGVVRISRDLASVELGISDGVRSALRRIALD
jgi:hypothetical protein